MFKTLHTRIIKLLDGIEATPVSLGSFTLAFLAIIFLRLIVEQAVNDMRFVSAASFFFTFAHYVLEILVLGLILLPILVWSGANTLKRAGNLFLTGLLVYLTPPITDLLILGTGHPFSLYEFGSLTELIKYFFTFFDNTPESGVTYGIRLEIALLVLVSFTYALLRKRKVFLAILSGGSVYTVLYVISTLPSWISLLLFLPEKSLLSISAFDAIGFFLSPKEILATKLPDPVNIVHIEMGLFYTIASIFLISLITWKYSPLTFKSLATNMRIPQAIWHGGLLFLGGAFAILFTNARLNFGFFDILAILTLIAAVESAWIASVVANDFSDRKIDTLTNPSRPLPAHTIPEKTYAEIGILFFLASLLFSAIISFKLALILLAYQSIAFLYSMPPLRLKRVPLLATFLSAIAGMLILLVGYFALSPINSLDPLPLPLLGFLTLAYMLTIPLKDFKDIKGDRADGVFTIPVLLGAERARLAIGSAIFMMYATSPIILRETTLIVPAILFGSLAFWSIIRAQRAKHSRLTFRTLAGWNIVFVTIYGIITALLLF